MRESKRFAQRSSKQEKIEPRKKYFLLFEGEETEPRYFDMINQNRDALNINPLIELVPLMRSYGENGWSSPKKILDRLLENLEEEKTGRVTYKRILYWITEYLEDERRITIRNKLMAYAWNIMCQVCQEDLCSNLDDEVEKKDIQTVCYKILSILQQEKVFKKMVDALPEIIKEHSITFEENFDKVCLIIDRDKHSFKADNQENDQYGYVLQKCREHGFGFYLSNPCFEFWLLLHYDKVCECDKDKLLKNEKKGRKTYIERELSKLLPGYSKSKYNVDQLCSAIDNAIKNEKLFCEDEEGLRVSLGSRVGLLMQELRTRESPSPVYT